MKRLLILLIPFVMFGQTLTRLGKVYMSDSLLVTKTVLAKNVNYSPSNILNVSPSYSGTRPFFRTLKMAVDSASAGTTIYVANGSYESFTVAVDSLTIIGSARPMFDSTTGTLKGGVVINGIVASAGKKYFRMENVGVQRLTAGDVYTTGSQSQSSLGMHHIYRNCVFVGSAWNNGYHAFLIQGGSDYTIENCAVYRSSHGFALRCADLNANNLYVEDCGSESGIILKSDTLTGDVRNININNFRIIGTRKHIAKGLIITSEHSVYVTKGINISNGFIQNAGGTAGIYIYQISGTLSYVNVSNVRILSPQFEGVDVAAGDRIYFSNVVVDSAGDNGFYNIAGTNCGRVNCYSTNHASAASYGTWADYSPEVGNTNLSILGTVTYGAWNAGYVTTQYLNLNGLASVSRDFTMQSGGVDRWYFRISGTESTGDAGGDFYLISRHDDGTFNQQVAYIKRSDGSLLWGGGNLSWGGKNFSSIGSLSSSYLTGFYRTYTDTLSSYYAPSKVTVQDSLVVNGTLQANNSTLGAVTASGDVTSAGNVTSFKATPTVNVRGTQYINNVAFQGYFRIQDTAGTLIHYVGDADATRKVIYNAASQGYRVEFYTGSLQFLTSDTLGRVSIGNGNPVTTSAFRVKGTSALNVWEGYSPTSSTAGSKIDTSGNATFGTISSGAITSTGLSTFATNGGVATVGAGDSVQVTVTGITTSAGIGLSYRRSQTSAATADTIPTWNVTAANKLTLFGKFGWVISYSITDK